MRRSETLHRARARGARCNQLRGQYDRALRRLKECGAIDDDICMKTARRQRNLARNLGKRDECKWITQRGLGATRVRRPVIDTSLCTRDLTLQALKYVERRRYGVDFGCVEDKEVTQTANRLAINKHHLNLHTDVCSTAAVRHHLHQLVMHNRIEITNIFERGRTCYRVAR